MGADQRMSAEVVGLEILVLGHAERALDQRRGAGVEERQVARIVDDAGRVAVAPLDAHARVLTSIAGGLPMSSARRHAQRAVEADHLAVEVACSR